MNRRDFFKRPDRSGGRRACWPWRTASGDAVTNYGMVSVDGIAMGTHRIAWTLKNGPIPAGLYVLHKCDNPPCVNPAHLFLGTQKDNMKDMAAKGRHNLRRKLYDAHRAQLRKAGAR